MSVAVWEVGEYELDFQLVQNGFVSAFRRSEVLERALLWLRNHGYRTVTFDAGAWTSAAAMHQSFASALDFPEYYGQNLDALNDCLSDAAEVGYGWTAVDTGLVLVLDGFDRFYLRNPEALMVLEILNETGQRAALYGNRILTLVRTDDPDAHYGPIGGQEVRWNPDEFLRSARST